jgi:ABC-2 type transport system ATP-binding protein
MASALPDPSQAPPSPALLVSGLRRSFDDGAVAVHDLSFHVNPGEVVGLLGANGAGKTTAMHIILGLMTPTSGSVRIFGMDPLTHREAILRRCNFASAYTGLPGNLLVWQNLTVFGRLYGVKNLKARIAELLDMFEIAHLRNRVTSQLSAGESTRLHLCKSLLNDPGLLMLDEPTASLDPDIADKVRGIHNMRDIEEVCDRVIFMHKGRVVASGTPTEVLAGFKENSMENVFIRIVRGGDLEEAPATSSPAPS